MLRGRNKTAILSAFSSGHGTSCIVGGWASLHKPISRHEFGALLLVLLTPDDAEALSWRKCPEDRLQLPLNVSRKPRDLRSTNSSSHRMHTQVSKIFTGVMCDEGGWLEKVAVEVF